MYATMCAALALALLSAPAVAQSGTAEVLGTASEILLPPYQAAALERDLPAADVRFADDQTLMVLGGSSLWRWQVADRTLKRLALRDGEGDDGLPLTKLGTDGLHWFAASDSGLFQVNWEEGRVFRFAMPDGGGTVLGFAGAADDYWLLHSAGLLKIDRYGRLLQPRARLPFLEPSDQAVLAPATQTLWFVRDTKLFRVDLATPDPGPALVLTAKHPLLDLQLAGAGLIARTTHAVLRLGADGHLKRSIPVEGRRRLVAMHIGAKAHAYLFDDHLLEVFRPEERATERYRLPLESGQEAGHLSLSGANLALTVDGRPRVFHLRAKP